MLVSHLILSISCEAHAEHKQSRHLQPTRTTVGFFHHISNLDSALLSVHRSFNWRSDHIVYEFGRVTQSNGHQWPDMSTFQIQIWKTDINAERLSRICWACTVLISLSVALRCAGRLSWPQNDDQRYALMIFSLYLAYNVLTASSCVDAVVHSILVPASAQLLLSIRCIFAELQQF